MLFSHVFFQDQRLVGLPSLRVHLPVWRHAHLVSSPSFPCMSVKVRKSWRRACPRFVPTGLKVSSTKCSGTSLYPTACTKVRSRPCCETCPPQQVQTMFLRLQVLFSFSSTTTRAAVCTDCERWESGTPWTWQSVRRAWCFRKHRNLFLFCSHFIVCVDFERCRGSVSHSSHSVCPAPAEGFQSWMWRGLTFLLPFLFFGHVSQVDIYIYRFFF